MLMIELSAQQKLALLFPSSNKAISKILDNATPEQLKTLNEPKNLKDILSQLTNEALDLGKSNKILLDVLKNSDFFKELGNFSKDLKSLTELLSKKNEESSAKNSSQKTAQSSKESINQTLNLLKSSLENFSYDDSSKIKDFVKNSGVFLESKFLKEKNPSSELKNSLQELRNELVKSENPQVQKVIKDIETLLQNSKVFDKSPDASSLSLIKKDVQNITSQLKNISSLADPIHSKDVEKLVLKLEKFTQNRNTETLSSIKQTIDELASELRASAKDGTKELAKQLEKIKDKIQNIIKENPTNSLIKNLAQELDKTDISKLTIKNEAEKIKLLSALSFTDLEKIDPTQLKTFFTNFLNSLSQTDSKTLFDLIDKILSSLKQSLESLEQKKIPQDIKSFLNNFEKELKKSDIVFSKSLEKNLDKISLFSKPAHLLNNNLLQEDLQKDTKALLLNLEKELSKSSDIKHTDALKTVDKLLTQIDYFQLVSYLSNSSCMYLPFSWEQLEDGNFLIKKIKDGSFYCEIDLQLKEFGKLNMMLQLFDKNQLNIMIYTEKDELKSIFKENIKELRSALVSADITPRNIRLHDLNENTKKASAYGIKEELSELGFEVKG